MLWLIKYNVNFALVQETHFENEFEVQELLKMLKKAGYIGIFTFRNPQFINEKGGGTLTVLKLNLLEEDAQDPVIISRMYELSAVRVRFNEVPILIGNCYIAPHNRPYMYRELGLEFMKCAMKNQDCIKIFAADLNLSSVEATMQPLQVIVPDKLRKKPSQGRLIQAALMIFDMFRVTDFGNYSGTKLDMFLTTAVPKMVSVDTAEVPSEFTQEEHHTPKLYTLKIGIQAVRFIIYFLLEISALYQKNYLVFL